MKNPQRKYTIIINIFIALTLVALAMTIYLTIASATITVPAARDEFSNIETLTISPADGEGDINGQLVSGEFEAAHTSPVSSKTTRVEKAGGTVTIINSTTRNQPLVATTRLLTGDDKLFRITQSVTVPAGGRVNVFAEADQPGQHYAISPTKFTIPGLAESLLTEIYAESSEPFTLDRREPSAITQSDIDRAREAATEKIRSIALLDLNDKLKDAGAAAGDQLQVEITSFNTSPAIGEISSSVDSTIKARVSALIARTDELERRAQSALMGALAEPELFVGFIPDSFSYTVSSRDEETSSATVTTEIRAFVKSLQSEKIDLKQLTGKNIEQAKRYLTAQGFTEARVAVNPPWIPILPFLESHIRLQLE